MFLNTTQKLALIYTFAILSSNLLIHNASGSILKLKPKISGRDYIDGLTEDVFDTMEELHTGNLEYNDPAFIDHLVTCMDSTNPDLKRASDLSWNGMLEYWDSDGVEGDRWGECVDFDPCVGYFEYNETTQSLHDATIYEPCNYASNLAYYHVSTTICDHRDLGRFSMNSEAVRALVESFSHLSFGSSFRHGSHTHASIVLDNSPIGVQALMCYQESARNLPNYGDPVVNSLSEEGRDLTAIQMNDAMTDMFLNNNVTEWEDMVYALDIPDYYLGFAGIVIMALTLTLEDDRVDEIYDFLSELFSMPADFDTFLREQFIPKIREGTADLELTQGQKDQLLGDFESALIKLLYAMIWQEWAMIDNPIVFEPTFNEIGARLIPMVNSYANSLNSFYNDYDVALQTTGENLYPGWEECNDWNPHGKWHQQAAAGLMDLIFLCDEMYVVTLPLLDISTTTDGMTSTDDNTTSDVNSTTDMTTGDDSSTTDDSSSSNDYTTTSGSAKSLVVNSVLAIAAAFALTI